MRAALRRIKADDVALEDITEEAELPTADVRELLATSAGTRNRIDSSTNRLVPFPWIISQDVSQSLDSVLNGLGEHSIKDSVD